MPSRRYIVAAAAALATYGLTKTEQALAAELPSQIGKIYPAQPLPEVVIHSISLANGKVLGYQDDNIHLTGDTDDRSIAHLITFPRGSGPATVVAKPNNETNLFCSANTTDRNGTPVVFGGQGDMFPDGIATITYFRNGNWVTSPDAMAHDRWYATALPLPSGEIVAVSGWRRRDEFVPVPEILGTDAKLRQLPGASWKIYYYPWLFPAPRGEIYMAGPKETGFLSVSGNGSWRAKNARRTPDRTRGTAVMYAPGKILALGGNEVNALKTAETIDLNATTPSWRATGSMRYPRVNCSSVLLPSGEVLVVGGEGPSHRTNAVLPMEIWNPQTGTWRLVASLSFGRAYHHTSSLTKFGTVVIAGSGRANRMVDQKSFQVYEPPYLHAGAQPAITSAPAAAGHSTTIKIGTARPQDVRKVTLIRLPSTTHSVHMSVGVGFPTFSPRADNTGIDVRIPGSTFLPPGFYLLYLVNKQGVPSVAATIRLN